MAFLPYDPTRRLSIQGQPAPADDWHAQWGGPPSQASGPGGGSVPFQAGPPPPMPDWSQYRGQTQWDQAMPPSGGFTPLSQLGRGGDPRDLAGQAARATAGMNRGPEDYLGGTGYQTRWKTGAAPMAPPATATGPAGGPGGMVLLRAPNGQSKQVPADQVAHYLARGATRG